MSNELGIDRSGNGNNWTVNNITYSDQVVDSPTNNFATFNPLITNQNSAVYSEGNLDWKSNTSGGQDTTTGSTIAVSTGKWYFEWFAKASSRTSDWMFGVAEDINELNRTSKYLGEAGNSYGYYPYDGDVYVGSGSNVSNYGSQADNIDYTGTVFSLAVDFDAGKMWVAHNGVWKNSGNPSAGTGHASITTGLTYSIAVSMASAGSNWVNYVANFGQDSSFAGNKTAQGNQDGNDIGDFYYTPPTGFLALCTKNLPDVAVIPSEHFNTVLYTGNGGTNAITGVGFQSDWTWIKQRSNADSNVVFDAVRGVHKRLVTDATAAEADWTSVDKGLDVFSSDGFTVKDDSTGNYSVNGNTRTYAAWNWKANGSGSSNTDGSITSTVSANVDAGFSIVNYTGNQTASATVGHGLSKAPEMVIIKNRDAAGYGWLVGHDSMTWEKYIVMNSTDAQVDEDVFNDTAPTASVFSPGGTTFGNKTGDEIIAYCFHSVDGYSKVGSYTGNGSTDGTFIYTGFRPAYIMVKGSTIAEGWYIFDTKRDPYNDTEVSLRANTSAAEGTGATNDFLSNGFKIRHNDTSWNSSGNTYIYIAFAESPFKYSNAR